jgi:fluoride exporter
MSVLLWAGVVAIGGLGSVLRFLIDRLAAQRAARGFPLGTLTVNVTGSLLLGLVNGLTAVPDVLLLAGVAAIGSYTTFSTWMLETQRLGEERQTGLAVGNLLIGVILGVAAAGLGRTIGVHL